MERGKDETRGQMRRFCIQSHNLPETGPSKFVTGDAAIHIVCCSALPPCVKVWVEERSKGGCLFLSCTEVFREPCLHDLIKAPYLHLLAAYLRVVGKVPWSDFSIGASCVINVVPALKVAEQKLVDHT
eukprot:1143818-Pelagomonas_calceolata.AAC.10